MDMDEKKAVEAVTEALSFSFFPSSLEMQDAAPLPNANATPDTVMEMGNTTEAAPTALVPMDDMK